MVLPYIKTNLPQVYMCSPSWTLLPPPSPYHPSGSSQCTNPKHSVSCIEPGLATRFIYDIIHISMPFSQIIPPSLSPTESKRLFYTSVSLLLSRIQGYCYHLSKFHLFFLYRKFHLEFVVNLFWWCWTHLTFAYLWSFWFLCLIWTISFLYREILIIGFLLPSPPPFIALRISCHSFLACKVSAETSGVNLKRIYLCYLLLFSCCF